MSLLEPGKKSKIPTIIGWKQDVFIAVMRAYTATYLWQVVASSGDGALEAVAYFRVSAKAEFLARFGRIAEAPT